MFYYNLIQVPKFTPFRSTTRCFRDTDRFGTIAPNDPKLTLNTTRSEILHMCYTTTTESQSSHLFALRLAIPKIIGFLRPIGHKVQFQSF